MRDQDTQERTAFRTRWAVPLVTALATWLIWRFGVEGILFAPDITATLLGVSVAANVGLVAYLVTSRR